MWQASRLESKSPEWTLTPSLDKERWWYPGGFDFPKQVISSPSQELLYFPLSKIPRCKLHWQKYKKGKRCDTVINWLCQIHLHWSCQILHQGETHVLAFLPWNMMFGFFSSTCGALYWTIPCVICLSDLATGCRINQDGAVQLTDTKAINKHNKHTAPEYPSEQQGCWNVSYELNLEIRTFLWGILKIARQSQVCGSRRKLVQRITL